MKSHLSFRPVLPKPVPGITTTVTVFCICFYLDYLPITQRLNKQLQQSVSVLQLPYPQLSQSTVGTGVLSASGSIGIQ